MVSFQLMAIYPSGILLPSYGFRSKGQTQIPLTRTLLPSDYPLQGFRFYSFVCTKCNSNCACNLQWHKIHGSLYKATLALVIYGTRRK